MSDKSEATQKQADPALPVTTLRDAIPHLRRPFSPEAVKFKVQTVFKDAKGCIVVAYIDARLVVERLNAVIPDGWAERYQPVDGAPTMMWCHITVDGQTRSDIGEGQGASDAMKRKAAVSDALKRAGVHFGVGVSVYALPQIVLFNDNTGRLEKARKAGGGDTLRLTEHGHKKLREGYAKWLEEHGERLFGPVLDHGDVEGANVDEEAEVADEFIPEPPAALEDDRALALVARARELYDGIDRQQLPPQRFNAWLTGAQHSHDELERLVAHLEERPQGVAA